MPLTERIETVIVGGGQAGLATSYYLSQQGCPHVVLEQAAEPGHVWRHQRWDSFTLATPNWATRLPGAEYQGDDPNGFIGRDALAAYFENYVTRFGLPIRYGVRVEAVEAHGQRGYRLTTGAEVFEAENVVMATGLFQKPRLPACAADLPSRIFQLPSTQYRAPHALPPARCWSSARHNRAARLRRSYIAAAARSICAWAAPAVRRAGIAARIPTNG